MNALSVFSFQENHPVRVVLVNGEPWFVAVDVCKALGLTNPTKSVSALDEDEKQLFSGDSNFKLGSAGKGAQSLIILNESGLYTLILRCRDAVKQGTTAWRISVYMRTYEREFLREVVRGARRSVSREELSIIDLGSEVEKVLPAHFELAINKLEALSTKLEAPAVSS